MRAFIKAHKIWSGIIVVAVLGSGYAAYHEYANAHTTAEYSIAMATQGPIQVTVTGSGQVSAEHELNLSPKASGEVTGVYVKAGQQVQAGALIATLDMTDAANAVRSAEQSLASAQISYQQTLTSSQDSTSNDQASVQNATNALSNSLASTYAALPGIMNGFDTALHSLSTLTGFSAEQNIDAYRNYVPTAESQQYYQQTVSSYAAAVAAYQKAQAAYAAYDAISPSPDQAQEVAQATIDTTQAITVALRNALTFYTYINTQSSIGSRGAPPQLATQISTLTGYLGTVSGDTSTIASNKTALTTALQSYQQNTQTLGGSDISLTIANAQLNVQKAQDALAQARQAEADYVVRAPFAGTIASVAAKKYDQASGGAAVAVLITSQNYVDLSLNEADAAKVQVGQPVALTFDALPDVTASGTVAEIDQVGTVSQGVVTFDVKVGLNGTDDQVKPGMTAQATITTASKASAILVPSSAVHTANGRSYVEIATVTGTSTPATGTGANRARSASSTSRFGTSTAAFVARANSFSRSFTVPATDVTMRQVPVTVGLTNDTMTEVTSGLSPRELVVTGTITKAQAGTSASSATTNRPNAGFGAFGAPAGGANATVRRATGGTGGSFRTGG